MAARVPGTVQRALVSLPLIAMLAACSAGTTGSPGASPGGPATSGGPAGSPAASPGVTARLIGRIMTPGAVDAIYPAPLLPTVVVRDVGPAGAAAIAAALRAAGLDGSASFAPGVPGDFGTTIFAVNLDGAVVTTRLVLGSGLPGRPGGGSPAPGVAAASDLVSRLQDPTE